MAPRKKKKELDIKKAIKRPGAFTAKAKRAGLTPTQYANKVLKKGSRASDLTKQQARFYKTLRKIAANNKKKKR